MFFKGILVGARIRTLDPLIISGSFPATSQINSPGHRVVSSSLNSCSRYSRTRGTISGCKSQAMICASHGFVSSRDVSFDDHPVGCGLYERKAWRKRSDAMRRNVGHDELAGFRRDDPTSSRRPRR